MAPKYYLLVLPFFLVSAAAQTDQSVQAFLSSASHYAQIDVTISPVN